MRKLGKLIRFMAVLMTLCLVLAAAPEGINVKASSGESFKIDGEWWSFDKSTGTITWVPYNWKGGKIPSEIDGTAVKRIGDWAVCNNDEGKRDHLKEIFVPDGVTEIGKGAFSGCLVVKVTLPDTVKTIGDYAFRGCACLEEMMIPGAVTAIGDSAFSDCICLKSIVIPKSVKSIGNYAFRSCEDLEEVIYRGKESDITFGKSVYSDCIFMHPDFSDPYKTSKFYSKLMCLKLNGDYIRDAISIAASQEGYNEGRTFADLDGMNSNYSKDYLKDYTEFNYYIGRPEWLWRPGLSEVGVYGGWCGQFCGWCINMAGIPNEAHQYLIHDEEECVLWKDTVYAGGGYTVKPGDVLHMKGGHYALVSAVTEKKNSVVFSTWNGNWPGVVKHDFEYNKKDGTMVDRDWKTDDLTEILIYKPEVIEDLPHYTVTFDANGGKTAQKSKDVCDGAYFGIMPVPERSGYVFDGWYTDKTGGTKIGAYRKAKGTGDITLYAHWKSKDGGADSDTGSKDDDTACIDPASVKVKANPSSLKQSTLKSGDGTVTLTVKDFDGKLSFANKTKGKLKKYVSIAKNGTVTVKKGAPKGTVKIKVTLKPSGGCEKITKTVKIKIK